MSLLLFVLSVGVLFLTPFKFGARIAFFLCVLLGLFVAGV